MPQLEHFEHTGSLPANGRVTIRLPRYLGLELPYNSNVTMPFSSAFPQLNAAHCRCRPLAGPVAATRFACAYYYILVIHLYLSVAQAAAWRPKRPDRIHAAPCLLLSAYGAFRTGGSLAIMLLRFQLFFVAVVVTRETKTAGTKVWHLHHMHLTAMYVFDRHHGPGKATQRGNPRDGLACMRQRRPQRPTERLCRSLLLRSLSVGCRRF